MHQTCKGQQWYSDMKLHIGVDSKTKLIHAIATTAANVHDATMLGELLHGNETRVYGDQAYRGQTAVIGAQAPNAEGFTNRRYRHRVVVDEVTRSKNRTKSGIRSKVEHSIGVIKRVFGFTKARYRGLAKIHCLASTAARPIGAMCPAHRSRAFIRGTTLTINVCDVHSSSSLIDRSHIPSVRQGLTYAVGRARHRPTYLPTSRGLYP